MYLLKEILKKAELTQEKLADELGIKSLSTINLKLNNKAEFTTAEAFKITDLINSKLHTNYTAEELFKDKGE